MQSAWCGLCAVSQADGNVRGSTDARRRVIPSFPAPERSR